MSELKYFYRDIPCNGSQTPAVMKRRSVLICCLLLQLTFIWPLAGQHIPYIQYLDEPWVDSVYGSLSTSEQIAQLVWISSGANQDPARVVAIDHLVSEVGIGGVIFSQVATQEELDAVDYYRSVGRVPLATGLTSHATSGCGAGLLSEGGVGSGAGLLSDFPGPATLASIANDSLLLEAGSMLAERLASWGFQVLLAPSSRGRMTEANMAGALREHHQLIATSYIPGSSDAAVEKEVGWMPGFREVIATDAAGTAGLAFCFAPDAGKVELAIGELETFAGRGNLEAGIIAHRVRMVLAFKYWAGLHNQQGMGTRSFREEMSGTGGAAWKAMLREIYASSLTVLTNRGEVIPVRHLDQTRVATLAINASSLTPFQRMAGKYTRTDHFQWMPGASSPALLMEQLKGYDLVLAGVYPGSYTLEELAQVRELVQACGALENEKPQVISVFFGGATELSSTLPAMLDPDGLILGYQHNSYTEELAAQLIFGGIGSRGRLPVSIGARYPAGSGIHTPGDLRLQFALPENAGISSLKLQPAIDSIVNAGLDAGAFPGCEVMVARKGMVIFHQTYGHHTYDRRIEVKEGDLYDLASVTKVSGPLSGLMVLEGAGQFSHLDNLGAYVPEMKRSDKATLPLRDILAHQAGLYPWIPYWQEAVRKNGKYRKRFLRYAEDRRFPLSVADHLYLRYNFNRRIQDHPEVGAGGAGLSLQRTGILSFSRNHRRSLRGAL